MESGNGGCRNNEIRPERRLCRGVLTDSVVSSILLRATLTSADAVRLSQPGSSTASCLPQPPTSSFQQQHIRATANGIKTSADSDRFSRTCLDKHSAWRLKQHNLRDKERKDLLQGLVVRSHHSVGIRLRQFHLDRMHHSSPD